MNKLEIPLALGSRNAWPPMPLWVQPRIPLIVVSPFTRGGHVNHTYSDHASIVKFIERNGMRKQLPSRSRDNLPNPTVDKKNPYVPLNAGSWQSLRYVPL